MVLFAEAGGGMRCSIFHPGAVEQKTTQGRLQITILEWACFFSVDFLTDVVSYHLKYLTLDLH